MRGTRVRWGCAFTVIVTAALLTPPARAAFQAVDQTRFLDVSAEAVSPPADDKHADHKAAPDFSPFDASLSASAKAGDPVVGSQALATATQQSTLVANYFTAGGSVESNTSVGTGTDAFASAEALLKIKFLVDVPTPVTIAESVGLVPDPVLLQSNTVSLWVTTADGKPVLGPVTVNDAVAYTKTMTFPAGAYTVSFDAKSVSGDEVDNAAQYTFSMKAAAPVAVPLPAGGSAGFALLAGLGVLKGWKARSAAARGLVRVQARGRRG